MRDAAQHLQTAPTRAQGRDSMQGQGPGRTDLFFFFSSLLFCGSRPSPVPTGSGNQEVHETFPRSVGLAHPKQRRTKWAMNRGGTLVLAYYHRTNLSLPSTPYYTYTYPRSVSMKGESISPTHPDPTLYASVTFLLAEAIREVLGSPVVARRQAHPCTTSMIVGPSSPSIPRRRRRDWTHYGEGRGGDIHARPSDGLGFSSPLLSSPVLSSSGYPYLT